MLFNLFLLSLCLAYNAADVINHLDCDLPKVPDSTNVEVDVRNCTRSHSRCMLIRKREYDVKITFDPTDNYTGITQYKVYGVFKEGLTVPYGRSKNAREHACRLWHDSEECPITGGFFHCYRYCHKYKFFVSEKYPDVDLDVMFQMRDKRTKKIMVCVKVPVSIRGTESPDSEEDENEST